MRVWDIHPPRLCRQHLLGQHREIHAIYNILTQDKKGYRNHPEVKRWEGKLAQLKGIHDVTALTMMHRGYNHKSPILGDHEDSEAVEQWQSTKKQVEILRGKKCRCNV